MKQETSKAAPQGSDINNFSMSDDLMNSLTYSVSEFGIGGDWDTSVVGVKPLTASS